MKTVKYEVTSGALITLLATRSFVFADLYTFLLPGGGTPLRYTTADTDIGYGGNVWTHGGPLFDKTDTRAVGHWKIGLDTDTWQCAIAPRPVDPITGATYPDKIGSVPWLAAVQAGALDGAVVLVDRCFLPSWPPMPRAIAIAPTGVVNIFTGRVATVDIGRSACVVSINSHMELLDQQMPINLYQAGCRHVLFDQGCGLTASAFAVSSTAGAGSTRGVIATALAAPGGSGTFVFGTIKFTGGLNVGFSRTIKAWAAGASFTLLSPLPFNVATGDAFTVSPGCDKQSATCSSFGNLLNFGGQPFIPPPETAA